MDQNATEKLTFTHNGRKFEVRVRRAWIAEVFDDSGKPAGTSVDATDEKLSDMKAQGYSDPLKRLCEEARDAFISRTS